MSTIQSSRKHLTVATAALVVILATALGACSSNAHDTAANTGADDAVASTVAPQDSMPPQSVATTDETTPASSPESDASDGGDPEALNTMVGLLTTSLHLRIPEISQKTVDCVDSHLRDQFNAKDAAQVERESGGNPNDPRLQQAFSNAASACLSTSQINEYNANGIGN